MTQAQQPERDDGRQQAALEEELMMKLLAVLVSCNHCVFVEQCSDETMPLRVTKTGWTTQLSVLPCGVYEKASGGPPTDARAKAKRHLPELCRGLSQARKTQAPTVQMWQP